MPAWPVSGALTGVPSVSRHTRIMPFQGLLRSPSLPAMMTTGVPSGSAPAASARIRLPWTAGGSPTGVPSASRHTRTMPSPPSLPAPMMTGVPSGSAPAATASTRPWTISGSPTGVPSASRHTRTVESSPPSLSALMTTGVPSGSAPAATARTAWACPLKTW